MARTIDTRIFSNLLSLFLSKVYIDELTNSGDTVMTTHSIACRLLAIAEKTAVNMVFVAMLVEGVYLHRMIVAIFRNKMSVKWLYGIGVGMCLRLFKISFTK